MSDSDDDVPLGARVKAVKEKPVKQSKPPPPVDSSSEDDIPLGARAQAKKPMPKKPAKPTSNGHVTKAPPAKKAKPAPEPVRKPVKKVTPKRKEASSSQGDKVKKERKVYDLPGQTRETPDETDPLRKFYTSLYEQRPNSQMAKKWLLQVGLLPEDEAHKVMEELARLKVSGLRSPAKPTQRSNGTVKRSPLSKGKAAPKAAPKPVPKKGTKRKEESDEEISSSDEEIMPKKKKRARDSSDEEDFKPQKAKPKAPPAKKKAPAKRDADFSDDSSADDKPLGARIKR